ncbi:trypsin-like serine protease [Candidatus Poriferisodalis sp.]|uniref:trypsin-like serine protease n=1 Tax=Candidatus Poriferisodalis sp. TaxID=3101277 RepID=UPI003B02CCD3
MAAYARDYSVSEAEAQRRLDRLDGIYEVIGSIRTLEAGRLAGWGIDHEGRFTGWVWLTGSGAPSSDAAAAADAHADVEIRLGASHSLQDLLDAQDSFGDGSGIGPVGRVSDGPGAVADHSAIITFTEVDMRANALDIGIDPALAPTTDPSGSLGGLLDNDMPPVGASGATDAELRAAITKLESAFGGQITVAFEVVDGRDIADTSTFNGGQPMTGRSANSIKCTAGFAAQMNGSGEYGLITAGHCDGTLKVKGVALAWVDGYASITADAELREIPSGSNHELRSEFVYGDQEPFTTRVVRSKAQREDMEDRFLCHQGAKSGLSCGTVTNIHHRPTHYGACRVSSGGDDTTCSNVFVRVHGPDLQACVGDSGGPWFSSSKAYGIQKSGTSPRDCSRKGVYATFSAIDEVEDFLDAEILLNENVTIP